MSVAASSPAWFTRSAEARNSFCSWVRGFRFLLLDDDDDDDASSLARGLLFLPLLSVATSAGRVGVVDIRRREELEENRAGTRKSWIGRCRVVFRARCAGRSSLAGGTIFNNNDGNSSCNFTGLDCSS